MAHVEVEQARTWFEAMHAILRPIELPRHCHCVGHAIVPKGAHVGAPQYLRLRVEVDAVPRCGHARNLRPSGIEAVEIHDDPPLRRVDMYIRRRNVRRRDLQEQIVRDYNTALFYPSLELRQLLRCHLRRLGQETRLLELQTAAWVNPPGSQQVICVCEPDVAALVVGEIEVIVTEPTLDPVRRPDHRWTLDIRADAGVHAGRNDGSVEQSLYAHAWLLPVAVHSV